MSGRIGENVIGDRTPFDVLTQAFSRWEGVYSSGIRFAFEGTTGTRDRDDDDDVNLLTLAPSESLGGGVLAATFLVNDASGILRDVDIVFSSEVDYTTSDSPDPSRYDLESVAAHEIGHLLGLEHTGLARATMAPFSDRGDVHQRTLESDDAIGASVLYPEGDFLSQTGTLVGSITLRGEPVFLSHVVATSVSGRIIASALTTPDGGYRIRGLPPDVYIVFAERLDGPIVPANVNGFRAGFGGVETDGYRTTFH
jgi:hypothetical protein